MSIIKVYRGGATNANVIPGAVGCAGYIGCRSPGNRMNLKKLDIMFNSYNAATNEWDNPHTDRFNYFYGELNVNGPANPFKPTTVTHDFGAPYLTQTRLFNQPGSYDLDYMFNDIIWFYVWTYNYAGAIISDISAR